MGPASVYLGSKCLSYSALHDLKLIIKIVQDLPPGISKDDIFSVISFASLRVFTLKDIFLMQHLSTYGTISAIDLLQGPIPSATFDFA